MADYPAPVANQIQPPDPTRGLNTFSSILGIRQQEQNLQTGLYQQAAVQAESQQAQQRNTELQNLANYTRGAIKQGSDLYDASGNFNYDKYRTQATAIAPVYGPAAINQHISTIKNVIDTRSAFQKLGTETNTAVSNSLKGLGTQPNGISDEDIQKFQTNMRSTIGSNPDAQFRLGTLIGSLQSTKDPMARQLIARNASAMLGGFMQQTPSAMTTGAQTFPGATSVWGAGFTPANGAQPPMSKAGGIVAQVPPSIATFPSGQLGRVGGVGGAPGAAPSQRPSGAPPANQHFGRQGNTILTAENDPNRPGMNAPKQVQEAWGNSVAQAQKDVNSAREADQYGNNMAVAGQIRNLLKDTKPGPGSSEWVRTVGAITSRFGGSAGVTNMQTLESFLDRQASSLRTGMNLPATNAGEEQARTIGGNIGMQGGAIAAKNNYNEALAQGLHDYRTGLDHVEHFSGNASPSAVNAFKASWAANFDPLAYEWKLAMQRGDSAGARAIAAEMSSADRATMQRKGRALDMLTQGKVPPQ